MKLLIIKSYLMVTLGLILCSLGWTMFLIPFNIVGGGINGIGVMVNHVSGFPVGLFYLIINFFLIFLAVKFLGASFGMKTIFGIVGFSTLLTIFQPLFPTPFLKDTFLATILGGGMAGLGLGLIFSQSASTGGTDIIAMIISKYTHESPGKISFYLNLGIIASAYIVYGSLESIIYGFVAMGVSSYVLDNFLEGSKQSAQLFIISTFYDKIALEITSKMGRGVTQFIGKGWYTQQQREVLMVIVRKREVPQVLKFVKMIDPKSFITISTVRGVYGEGFEKIQF